jgi:hypothetical protein
VVGVVVGQDDGRYRVERPAQFRERRGKLLEVAGEAAVDHGDRAVEVVQIPAHPLRAEPVDTVRDVLDRDAHDSSRRTSRSTSWNPSR